MPRYMGQEFYKHAIFERTTALCNKIFNIPDILPIHCDECCIGLNFEKITTLILENGMLHGNETLKTITIDSSKKDFFLLDKLLSSSQLRKNMCLSEFQDKESLEIIPSSYPESECSINFDLSFEDELNSFDFQDNIVPCKLNGKSNAIDVPIFPSELQLPINRYARDMCILTQLKIHGLKDPFVKKDGSFWKEDDIFKYDLYYDFHHEIPDELKYSIKPVLHLIVKIEHYDLNNNVEVVMFPSLHEKENLDVLTPVAFDLNETFFSCNETLLLDLLKEKINNLHILEKLHESSCVSVSEIMLQPGICNVGQYEKSELKEMICQPVLSFDLLESSYLTQSNVVTELIQDLSLQKLDLSLSNNPLLSKEKLYLMSKKVWENEKHFDEIPLPVPIFPQTVYPDLLDEILKILGISEYNIASLDESLSWSLNIPIATHTLMPAALYPDKFENYEVKPPEIFKKIPFFDFDFHWDITTVDNIGNITGDETMLDAIQLPMPSDSDEQSPDPLDSYIYVRSNKISDRINNQLSTKAVDKIQPQQSIITPMISSSYENTEIIENSKTITVNITGPTKKVLEFIQDIASPHVDLLKKGSKLSANEYFMDISADQIQFLLKEYEKLFSNTFAKDNAMQEFSKKSTLQSLCMVHSLRVAAEFLVHSCLEACISWIASQIEIKWINSLGSIQEIYKQLLQYQCNFHNKNILHPKLTTLCHEIEIFLTAKPKSKVLVVIQQEIPKLSSVIQHVVSKTLKLTAVISDLKILPLENPSISVFIVPYMECHFSAITFFSLVVVFDSRMGTYLKTLCMQNGVSYVDLLAQYSPNLDTINTNGICNELTPALTMICSTCVTQYRELVVLLEARYNIAVEERDYYQLKLGKNVYFADLIVSLYHGIILISLQDLNRNFNLDAAAKRFIVMRMQFSYCYIILHGIGASCSYLLNKETMDKIYNLQSMLINMSGTYEGSKIQFKILYCLSEEDVAKVIKNIASLYSQSNSEQDLTRPWISSEISSNEKFLLQFHCFNSLSAQLLLKSFSVEEILHKSEEEIEEHVPQMSKKVFLYLSKSVQQWKVLEHKRSDLVETKSATTNSKGTSNGSDSPTYSPLEYDLYNFSPVQKSLSPLCASHDQNMSNSEPSAQQKQKECQDNWIQPKNIRMNCELFEDDEQTSCIAQSQPHMISNEDFKEIQSSSEDSSKHLSDEYFPENNCIVSESMRANVCKCRNYKHFYNENLSNVTSNLLCNGMVHNPMSHYFNKDAIDLRSVQDLRLMRKSNENRFFDNCKESFDIPCPQNVFNQKFYNHSSCSIGTNPKKMNFYQEYSWKNTGEFLHENVSPDEPNRLWQNLFKENEKINQRHSYVADNKFSSTVKNDQDYIQNRRFSFEFFQDPCMLIRNRHIEENHKTLGVVAPVTGCNRKDGEIDIPYFSGFSQSDRHTPIQLVKPSKKGNFINKGNGKLSIFQQTDFSNVHASKLSELLKENKREFDQLNKIGRNMSPYLPRPKISIGLATPLRKQCVEENIRGMNCPSNIVTQRCESPPLDLVEDIHLPQLSLKHDNNKKLQKWNHDLMAIADSEARTYKKYSGVSDSSEPLYKKRKLEAVKKAGNNGQTVLVFK